MGSDTALSTVLQAVAAVTNLALRILVYRSLATEAEAGVFALVLTYLSLASAVADFGLAATLQPRIASEPNLASAPLKVGLVLRLITSLAGWVLINIVLVLAGRLDVLAYVNVAYLAILFSARMIGVRQFLEIAWRMNGRGYLATLAMVIDALLALGVALVLVATDGLTVWSVAILWSLGGIPGFLLLVVPLRRVLAESFRGYRLRPVYLKRIGYAALPVAVMYLIGQFTGQLETLVLDALGSIEDVGRFNVAISPLQGILFLPGAIAAGVGPLVARLWRRPQADMEVNAVVSVLLRIIGVVALAVAVVTVVSAEEIVRLFPQSTEESVLILRGYAGVTAMVFLVVGLDVVLLAIGRRRTVLIGSIIAVVLALILEVATIATWGVVGLLTAKAVSLVALISYQLMALRRNRVHGASAAVLRLIPGTALFVMAWALGAGGGIVFEFVLPCLAAAVGLMSVRVITREDVRMLRSARLW